jgi:sigma-B regulation protein RsbU (phosphoserine phosphatase)
LDVVRRLQEMILPLSEELQQIEGIELTGFMKPADEVGGDYYDIFQHNQQLHIGIGDVTGHGLESGVLMLMAQTAIRTLIDHGETDPVIFLNTLNRVLYHNIQRMNVDKSLTLSYINYHNGQLKIIGQHEHVIVVRNNGQETELVDTINLGFPVGLEPDISQWVNSSTITLSPGDGIVLYTDGITEAVNLQNKMYGLQRLCDVVSRNWSSSVDDIKRAVMDEVIRYIGTQKIYDDLTLVILKVHP